MSEPYDVLRAYIDEPVGWSNENDTAAQDAARIALGLASEEVRELRAERRGVKLDEDLERAIRESAHRRGETVEVFVARACGERLHADTYEKG